jgi:hypothetical protein
MRNLADGESRATPGIPIHFGENRTCDANLIMECARQVCGFLPSHGINHQQNFMGLHRGFNLCQLSHHLLVNL